ncbi:MAG TPA: pyridoxal-phosphate dependent enzyme [Cyclobacteriaceae bacterium]|nr:pyridoxal-phosphate dependent enzyme [Cyclobacteriaceae bacterium]
MLDSIPELRDIILSYNRIKTWTHKTPVMTSSLVNELAGCRVFFKCENFQKTGSFKFRGASNVVLQLPENMSRNGVSTHSSGNHAQALALAANLQGIKSFIVMPENAPDVKRNAVKAYGGNVISCKPGLSSREETLANVTRDTRAFFIHPYNNFDIISGQATSAYEFLCENPSLDSIIAPVGGGGLLSGTCLAAHYLNPRIKVYGAEPAGAPDAFKSLQAGKIIPSEHPNTLADGLLTSLGEKTFPVLRDHLERIILVSDEDIISAMQIIWERMKIIVEPSGAVSFAAMLHERKAFKGSNTGIIISGGNVNISQLPFQTQ